MKWFIFKKIGWRNDNKIKTNLKAFLRFQKYFHQQTKELGQTEVPLMFLTFQAKTVLLPSFEFHYDKE